MAEQRWIKHQQGNRSGAPRGGIALLCLGLATVAMLWQAGTSVAAPVSDLDALVLPPAPAAMQADQVGESIIGETAGLLDGTTIDLGTSSDGLYESTIGSGDTMGSVVSSTNGLDDNDEIYYGRLQNSRPGCDGASDAQLIYCDGAQTLWVNAAGLNVRPFVGQSVAIRGTLKECGGERYIQLNSIEQTRRCEPQSTGQPEKQNLALFAPPTANTHEQPNISAMATDGDALSYWYAPGADAWIYIDLGPNIDPDGNGDPAGATFNEARLLWGERYATQYGVYVFDPVESRWARIFQKSDGKADETISFPRSYGRYVLFQMARSSEPEGGFMLREIELYGVETPNAALGSQPRASSAQPDRPTWQAIDSDEASAWASQPGGIDPNPWIYVQLPATTPLTEFKLLWDEGAMPAFFRVGFYQNGEISVWSQQFQSTNARQRLAWGLPIDTDAFYIYTELLGPAGFIQLQELELYGDEPGKSESFEGRTGHGAKQAPTLSRFTELLPLQIRGLR